MQKKGVYNQTFAFNPLRSQSQKYKKIKVLGEGSVGKVYLVECPLEKNKLYVIKRINIGHLNPKQKQQALHEVQVHSMFRHQNIIEFKEIYHTTQDKLCIVMQYASGGDLDSMIKNFTQKKTLMPEETILKIFTQICLGVREIHAKKVIHRDLKGANILIGSDNKIKIGDFGISKAMDRTIIAAKSFAGTPYYLSPEMVEGKPYSTKTDIWAMGVILYQMTTLKLPFDANSLAVLALKILKGSFPPITTASYSRELKHLIFSMLQVDQKRRPSINEIICKPLLARFLPKYFVQYVMPEVQAKLLLQVEKKKSVKKVEKNPLKVVDNVPSEEEKAKKREHDRLKREEERKRMRDDIKVKKMITGDTQRSDYYDPKVHHKHQDSLKKHPSCTNIKYFTDQKQRTEPAEKPWLSKNGTRQKRQQPQVEIFVPGHKKKAYGDNYPAEKTLPQEVGHPRNYFDNGKNSDLNRYSQLAQNQYAPKTANKAEKKKIEMYKESDDFDTTTDVKNVKNNFKKLDYDAPRVEERKLTDAGYLEQLRWILQDRLGEKGFIHAYNVVKNHFDETNQRKRQYSQRDQQDFEIYLFNRKVLREKLHFLTLEQFDLNIELLYTISVMEDLQMMKNYGHNSEEDEDEEEVEEEVEEEEVEEEEEESESDQDDGSDEVN